jgi:hypothetical protein
MMVRSSARVDLGIQHVGIVLFIRWRSGPSVGRDRTGPECRRKVVPVLVDRQRLDGALHERRGIGVMNANFSLLPAASRLPGMPRLPTVSHTPKNVIGLSK